MLTRWLAAYRNSANERTGLVPINLVNTGSAAQPKTTEEGGRLLLVPDGRGCEGEVTGQVSEVRYAAARRL